jgi:hypothetical protein
MDLASMLRRVFRAPTPAVHRIDEADKRSREMKHTLRNIAMRSSALRQLVERMRDDETWHRPNRGGDAQ